MSGYILGTWRLLPSHFGPQDPADSQALIKAAPDYGIQSIDTAGFYAKGQIESFLANQLKKSPLKIISKVGLVWQGKAVKHQASPEALKEQVQASLQKLKKDHLDCVLLHHPDPAVPFEESCAALKAFCVRGLAKCWGICNVNYDQASLAADWGASQWHMEHNILQQGFPSNKEKISLDYVAFSILAQGFVGAQNWQKNDWRLSSHQASQRKIYTAALSSQSTVPNIHNACQWIANQKQLDQIILGPRNIQQLVELQQYLTSQSL